MAEQSNKTLLIVEHQASTREALARVFRGEGYHVVTATNAQEAMAQLRGAVSPQIILLDLVDAEADRREFLEARLKDDRLAAVPVVVIAEGNLDADWISSLRIAGSFQKPVPLDPLISLVRQCA
jgi:CheY-like chemotaxis protein